MKAQAVPTTLLKASQLPRQAHNAMFNRREFLIGSIVTTVMALSKAHVPTASEIEYGATISQLEKDGFVFFECNEPLSPDVLRALRRGRVGVISGFSPDAVRAVTVGTANDRARCCALKGEQGRRTCGWQRTTITNPCCQMLSEKFDGAEQESSLL
jgi:hypothetical protein